MPVPPRSTGPASQTKGVYGIVPTHPPNWHVSPAGQATPQPAQLNGSLFRSTQKPPQSVSPWSAQVGGAGSSAARLGAGASAACCRPMLRPERTRSRCVACRAAGVILEMRRTIMRYCERTRWPRSDVWKHEPNHWAGRGAKRARTARSRLAANLSKDTPENSSGPGLWLGAAADGCWLVPTALACRARL